MDAVILFSHGSLLCGAGEALKVHAARLRERGIAPIVEVGYLNYSTPPFAETVDRVVAQGATRVIVAPYFLIPGKFVKVDLPHAVQAAQDAHPDITFVVRDAIGFDVRLADAILDSAHAPFGSEFWREDLNNAAQFCRANPDCPLFGGEKCPAGREGEKERRREGEEEKRRRGDTIHNPQSTIYNPKPSTLNSLLILIHGSPRPIANTDMFRVVEVIRERGVFPIVEVGFMECNAPDIPEAIAKCVAQGAASVVAVPYFLHTGTHVADDLPTLIEQAQEQYPQVKFAMGGYLGRSEKLTDILADRISVASQGQTSLQFSERKATGGTPSL